MWLKVLIRNDTAQAQCQQRENIALKVPEALRYIKTHKATVGPSYFLHIEEQCPLDLAVKF